VLVALYAGIGAGPSTPTEHESPQRMPELHAVFTRRRGDLRRHAGEISFPGGRLEPEDADLPAAALREAEEEIGLPREEAILVGALTPASTFVTGYAIYPFVGLLRPGRPWMPSPTEVDAVLEFPLRVLRDARQQVSVSPRGVSFLTDAYVVGEHSIWGATARIVDDLLARLAAVPQLLV
jgi:8-oxo-dGTP pyrophosphatase MutT (NUDIX family)